MSKHRTRHPRTGSSRGASRTTPWSAPGRTGPEPRPRGPEAPRQPVALAVVGGSDDFERLRRHRLFGSADHSSYLRRTEGQLRTLRGSGLDVHLRLLDAKGYEDYCAERLLDPGDPVARVAYAADPEFLGDPFVYGGQQLAELLPALTDDHQARARIATGCAALLAAMEGGAQAEARLAALLDHAADVYLAVAAGAGEGRHRAVLRCAGPGGREAAVEVGLSSEGGRLSATGREAEVFCVTLAAAFAGRSAGRLLLYNEGPPHRVYGWSMAEGRLRPMAAPELRALPVGRARGTVHPGFALPEQSDRGPAADRGG